MLTALIVALHGTIQYVRRIKRNGRLHKGSYSMAENEREMEERTRESYSIAEKRRENGRMHEFA